MNTVERAAWALALRQGEQLERAGATNMTPDVYADRNWRDQIPTVRAVMTAIRDPEALMLTAGTIAPRDGQLPMGGAKKIWQAMIDAALAEGA